MDSAVPESDRYDPERSSDNNSVEKRIEIRLDKIDSLESRLEKHQFEQVEFHWPRMGNLFSVRSILCNWRKHDTGFKATFHSCLQTTLEIDVAKGRKGLYLHLGDIVARNGKYSDFLDWVLKNHNATQHVKWP
jgi:hypothetical protein